MQHNTIRQFYLCVGIIKSKVGSTILIVQFSTGEYKQIPVNWQADRMLRANLLLINMPSRENSNTPRAAYITNWMPGLISYYNEKAFLPLHKTQDYGRNVYNEGIN